MALEPVVMTDRSPWSRLLADPLLHMLLIAVGLICLAFWRASNPALGYDPINDARVIYTRQPVGPVPLSIHLLKPQHAG
jgi:hypothetical protein